MGAGCGWVAYLLSERGIEIKAYDCGGGDGYGGDTFIDEWRSLPWYNSMVLKGGIEVLQYNDSLEDCEAMGEMDDPRTLLICWPDLDTAFATEALKQFRGNAMLYIGEEGEIVSSHLLLFSVYRC